MVLEQFISHWEKETFITGFSPTLVGFYRRILEEKKSVK